MLNREVVKEFLKDQFKPRKWKLPKGITWDSLSETFCCYTEDDYYEWLKDNFKSFFNHGNPDWKWIKDRIKHNKRRIK